jgi:Fe-S cluster biogenesis protein NfuA
MCRDETLRKGARGWAFSDTVKVVDTEGAAARAGEAVLKACKELLAPLVHADGGVLYIVSASADDVHIHLAGTCAGCPGAALTSERLVQPAIEAVVPRATVRVTTGFRVPEGAKKVDGT